MLHLLMNLSRWLRGGPPAAVSAVPQSRPARGMAGRALRMEPLEDRVSPGIIWGD